MDLQPLRKPFLQLNKSDDSFEYPISNPQNNPSLKQLNILLQRATPNKNYQEQSSWRKFYLRPENKFVVTLQFINLSLIYLYFFEIPITIAFQNHRSEQQTRQLFSIINFPAITIFFITILINLKTAFYRNGALITDQSQIIKHYVRLYLVVDVIAITSIGIYQVAEPITYRFIVLLFYLKFFEAIYIERSVILIFDLQRTSKATFKLFLLFLKIFLLCNTVACGFFYLSDILCSGKIDVGLCEDCCWVNMMTIYNNDPLKKAVWSTQYIFSLYWASTTMISIGYGDIVPKNQYEIMFTILMEFISALVYAYSLNQMWEIIKQYSKKKSQIRFRIEVANRYMRDKQISQNVKNRVNAYLTHYYNTNKLRQKEIQTQIIQQLTPQLRKELLSQSFGVLFKAIPLFAQFDEDILAIASSKIQQTRYFYEEVLFEPETEYTHCLFFIKKGSVSNYVKSQYQQLQIAQINSGQVCGMYEFLTQQSYQSYCKALEYSQVFSLSSEKWIQHLRKYSKQFQIYMMLRDCVFFYSKLNLIGISCKFCGSRDHRSQRCLNEKIWQDQIRTIQQFKDLRHRNSNFHRFRMSSRKIISDVKHIKEFIVSQKRKKIQKKRRNSLDLDNIQIRTEAHHPRKDSMNQNSKKLIRLLGSIHNKAANKKVSIDELDFLTIHHQQPTHKEIYEHEQQQEQQFLVSGTVCVDKLKNYEKYFPLSNCSASEGLKRRATLSFKY